MQRKGSIVPVFLLFLLLSLVIFFFSQKNMFQTVGGGFELALSPLQRLTFAVFHINGGQSIEDKLRQENAQLRIDLAKQKEIEKENKALHDQFQIADPAPKELLPSQIVGYGNNELILDKGTHDKVAAGQVVILQDNLIGIVTDVSPYRAVVRTVMDEKMSFTAHAVKTDAQGVIYGRGSDEIIFGNVVLSDTLEQNDIVTTRGDVDSKGRGFPPDLVVGKIVSINKRASSLFQVAEIKSLVDFSKLETVFVLLDV